MGYFVENHVSVSVIRVGNSRLFVRADQRVCPETWAITPDRPYENHGRQKSISIVWFRNMTISSYVFSLEKFILSIIL